MDMIEAAYRDDQRQQAKSELIDPNQRTGAPNRMLPTAVKTGNQFTTACIVQHPRSLKVVNDRLEKEAHLAGEEFFYSWDVGNKNNDKGDKVEGPSIKLAMAAFRCYGNCVLDMDPIQETDDSWIFTASFVDLETGCTIKRPFRMDKNFPVYGKMDQFRKADVRFQIGTSKATRNVILASLPAGLIKNAMAAAHDAVREKLIVFIRQCNKKANKPLDDQYGVTEAAKSIISMLNKKYGVTEAIVCAKYEVPKIEGLGLEEIILLRADYVAINSGQASVEELFPMDAGKTQVDTDDLEQRMRRLAAEKPATEKPKKKKAAAKTEKPEPEQPEPEQPEPEQPEPEQPEPEQPEPEQAEPQEQELHDAEQEPEPEEEELPPLLPPYIQHAALRGNNAVTDSDVDEIDNEFRDQIRHERDLDAWIEYIDWLRREVERRQAVNAKTARTKTASPKTVDAKQPETKTAEPKPSKWISDKPKDSGKDSGSKQGEIFE